MRTFRRMVIRIHRLMFDSRQIYLIPLLIFIFSASISFSEAQPASNTPDYYKFQGRISPSMSAGVIAFVCVFFFIGFFAVYVRHCTDDPNGSNPVNPHITSSGGLDPELIDSFPIIVYSEVKDHKIGKVPLECAVCLNEFEEHESLRLLTKCDHVFHPECIDAWLAAHITCPVCRTNLSTENAEIVEKLEQQAVSNESPSEPNPRSEIIEEQNQVSINITGDRLVEIPQTIPIPNKNRPPRAESINNGKLPRSHSTGHSLVRYGENLERFTLKLPEDVRKQIEINSMLNRTRGNVIVYSMDGSSKKGYRSGGEGSKGSSSFIRTNRADQRSKSDRWVFTRAPPFVSRAG